MNTSKPENNTPSRIMELEAEVKRLRGTITSLAHAAKLIAKRKTMISGSPEMANCDAYCKGLGLRPWDREWYKPVRRDLF